MVEGTICVSLSITYMVFVPEKPLSPAGRKWHVAAVVTPHIPCAKAGALPSRPGGTQLVIRRFHPCLQKEEHFQVVVVVVAFLIFGK